MPFKLKKSLRKKTAGSYCSAVIAAAGSSNRMNGVNKLFIELLDKPVLAHVLLAFEQCEKINEIVIVTKESDTIKISEIIDNYDISKVSKLIYGGETRLQSVLNGVLAVSEKAKLIAIHDAARPCINQTTIIKTIDAAIQLHAASPAVKVTSTIKKVEKNTVIETVDRSNLYEFQTPQIFDADLIKAALTNAVVKSLEITDDCSAVEAIGGTVYMTEGSYHNIKLTTKDDILIAESILASFYR